MTEPELTPVEERARAAALAEYDREEEIVLERWSKWLVEHPITKDEMPAATGASSVNGSPAGPKRKLRKAKI